MTHAPLKVRAQTTEVSMALLTAVERHGSAWWSAWDALQLSPVGIFDGGQYRGFDRLSLAALSLSRGLKDRRWASAEEASAHGFQPRRGARGALLSSGQDCDTTMAYNAETLVRSRDSGRRHGTTVFADEPPPTMGEEDVNRAAFALMTCGLCPVLRDRCERATYLPEARVIVVPSRDRRGHTPATLRELCEALARSIACRRQPDDRRLGEPELSFIAALASVMTLSDVGMAPVEACPTHEGTSGIDAALPGLVRLVGDVEGLAVCARRAEEVSARLTDVLALARGDPHEGGGDEGHADAQLSDEQARIDAVLHVRLPLKKPNVVPYGSYRLRDVVSESEHASDALARSVGRK